MGRTRLDGLALPSCAQGQSRMSPLKRSGHVHGSISQSSSWSSSWRSRSAIRSRFRFRLNRDSRVSRVAMAQAPLALPLKSSAQKPQTFRLSCFVTVIVSKLDSG